MAEELTVAEIEGDLEAELKLIHDTEEITPWQFQYTTHVHLLLTELANKERETAEKCVELVKDNMVARLNVSRSWISFSEEAIVEHFGLDK